MHRRARPWSHWLTLGFLTAAVLVATVPAGAAGGPPGGGVAFTAPAPVQPAGPVAPVAELESEMLASINAERAAAGVPPVRNQDWAHAVAQQHAQQMAAARDVFHNGGYLDQGHAAMGALFLGENVAMDSILPAADNLLFTDPAHRNITLDPGFNFVGVGIAYDAQNWVFLTEDFAQIGGGPPPVAQGPPITLHTVAAATPVPAHAPVAVAPVQSAPATTPVTPPPLTAGEPPIVLAGPRMVTTAALPPASAPLLDPPTSRASAQAQRVSPPSRMPGLPVTLAMVLGLFWGVRRRALRVF